MVEALGIIIDRRPKGRSRKKNRMYLFKIKSHFKRLNKRLRNSNPINIEPPFRDDINTY